MRGKWLLISGTVILAAIAAGALSLLRHNARKPVQSQAVPPRPQVFAGAEVSLMGILRAQHVVQVAAPTDGTIESLTADVGQEVYEGELLGRIRNTGLESDQQAAQAAFERAQGRVASLEGTFIAARLEASRAHADASRSQTEFERTQKVFLRQQFLYKEGATPRLVFEKAQQEFEAAQAEYSTLDEVARQADNRVASLTRQIDEAKKLLDETTRDLEDTRASVAAAEIHSPVDGLVVARSKQVGDEVDQDVKELFRIATDLMALEVVLDPEPPVLARIRAGQEAIVQIAELGGQGLPGRVTKIEGTQVVVEFTSPSPAVRPGLTAQVRIKLT